MKDKQRPPFPSISPDCVLKVGDGRGFLVKYRVSIPPLALPALKGLRTMQFTEQRVVVTAAHCLPRLPPAHAAAYTEERTHENLLGRLNDVHGRVCAQCLFADPVADIAVLGGPDEQERGVQAEAYQQLTEQPPALGIAEARSGPGWVLSLDGCWTRITIQLLPTVRGSLLSIDKSEPGMSGSPILNDVGRAVGVVVVGPERVSKGVRMNEETWHQPILSQNLPGWLLGSRRRKRA